MGLARSPAVQARPEVRGDDLLGWASLFEQDEHACTRLRQLSYNVYDIEVHAIDSEIYDDVCLVNKTGIHV